MSDYVPGRKYVPHKPLLQLLETTWEARSPSGRVLTCGIYRTDAGFEVRCGYRDDLVRSQYAGAIELARDVAAEWRTQVKGGFSTG